MRRNKGIRNADDVIDLLQIEIRNQNNEPMPSTLRIGYKGHFQTIYVNPTGFTQVILPTKYRPRISILQKIKRWIK